LKRKPTQRKRAKSHVPEFDDSRLGLQEMPTRCQEILDQLRPIPSVVGVERLLDRKIEPDVATIAVMFFSQEPR